MPWPTPDIQASVPDAGDSGNDSASPATDAVPLTRTEEMLGRILTEMAEMRAEMKADMAEMKATLAEMRAEISTAGKIVDSSVATLSSTDSVLTPQGGTDDSTLETDDLTNDEVGTSTVPTAEDKPSVRVTPHQAEWDSLEKFAEEFQYFLDEPYFIGNVRRPSESFVQALFPPLVLQERARKMPTSVEFTRSDLELPAFSWNDPELHTKLENVQYELRRHFINIKDWPAFAMDACSELPAVSHAWTGDFCWHHFVFAVICDYGLYNYYQRRDAAFTIFTRPVNQSPEDVVRSLCDELRFAPVTHKTTTQRAMEFDLHLHCLDRLLKRQIPRFVPNGSHMKLVGWAYSASNVASEYWRGERNLYKELAATRNTRTAQGLSSRAV
ncbi:hypothetical protein SEPCBS57363_003433 [Sporothrix epigloea]|uniref:Uncharacterized protein n=1 Tax=Sporothrix epigloea TaxID=1892477 RepID=A0ABP0DMN2_9PEZI